MPFRRFDALTATRLFEVHFWILHECLAPGYDDRHLQADETFLERFLADAYNAGQEDYGELKILGLAAMQARLTERRSRNASAELARWSSVVARLREEYIVAFGDDTPPRIVMRRAWPPEDWMNERLAAFGCPWKVQAKGSQMVFVDAG